MRKTRKKALSLAFQRTWGRPPHRSELRRERKNYSRHAAVPYDAQRLLFNRVFARITT